MNKHVASLGILIAVSIPSTVIAKPITECPEQIHFECHAATDLPSPLQSRCTLNTTVSANWTFAPPARMLADSKLMHLPAYDDGASLLAPGEYTYDWSANIYNPTQKIAFCMYTQLKGDHLFSLASLASYSHQPCDSVDDRRCVQHWQHGEQGSLGCASGHNKMSRDCGYTPKTYSNSAIERLVTSSIQLMS